MDVLNRKLIINYIRTHPDFQISLECFLENLEAAHWKVPSDVLNTFSRSKTDTFKDNKVCVNVAGNKLRIIFKVNFNANSAFIKWIGLHTEYNKLNIDKAKYLLLESEELRKILSSIIGKIN